MGGDATTGKARGSRVRLAVWNTARRPAAAQAERLARLAPHIAVLPEFGRLPLAATDGFSSFVEVGEPGRLGIGVAAWGDWRVSLADVAPIEGKVVGAIDVDGPRRFKLIAVWAYLTGIGRDASNPVTEAVDAWASWYEGHDLVVAGDFNSGGQWVDLRTGPRSHYPIVSRLAENGLRSAYHTYHSIEQGDPELPTFWNASGSDYTIDHVFAPHGWEIAGVIVGGADPWKAWSDHAPVIAEFLTP